MIVLYIIWIEDSVKLSLRRHDRIWGEVANRAFSVLRIDHSLALSQSQSYTNSYRPASLDIFLMVLVISAIHSSVLFCPVLSCPAHTMKLDTGMMYTFPTYDRHFIYRSTRHTSNHIECKFHLHKVCFIEAYNFLNLISIINFDAFFSFCTFFHVS